MKHGIAQYNDSKMHDPTNGPNGILKHSKTHAMTVKESSKTDNPYNPCSDIYRARVLIKFYRLLSFRQNQK